MTSDDDDEGEYVPPILNKSYKALAIGKHARQDILEAHQAIPLLDSLTVNLISLSRAYDAAKEDTNEVPIAAAMDAMSDAVWHVVSSLITPLKGTPSVH